jgi:hypothetical protein
MSRAEVALLGPPGDYTTGPMYVPNAGFVVSPEHPELRDPSRAVWATDSALFVADFDRADRIEAAVFNRAERVPQGAAQNLLWRAKRQWHRWFP